MARPGTIPPGTTRNPNGRPKKEWSLTQAMRDLLSEKDIETKLLKRDILVQKAYQKALDGDPTSMKLVWNYLEGMPTQAVDVTSGGDKIGGLSADQAEQLLRARANRDAPEGDSD